jgi:hypothetical protein
MSIISRKKTAGIALSGCGRSYIYRRQATAFLEFIKGNLDYLWGIDPGYKDELLTRSGELNPKYNAGLNE